MLALCDCGIGFGHSGLNFNTQVRLHDSATKLFYTRREVTKHCSLNLSMGTLLLNIH